MSPQLGGEPFRYLRKKGLGRATNAASPVVPELLNPNSWIMTPGAGGSATNIPPGTLNLVSTGVTSSGDQSFPTIPGKTYRLTATIATAATNARAGTSQGGTQYFNATAAVGPYSNTFVATATTSWVRFGRTTTASTVSNISIKEVE